MMMSGTVKWFNGEKGIGIIAQDTGDPDLSVHSSALEGSGLRTLEENQKVMFEVVLGPNGPTAENVRTAEY